jgi:hypothetical protein
MAKTLTAGEHKLAFTRGVNDKIAEDKKFTEFVMSSLVKFNRGDWGDVADEDWKANDADLKALNNGGWYGRILGSYFGYPEGRLTRNGTFHIWITRNTAEEDGTQAITVLFPSEY